MGRRLIPRLAPRHRQSVESSHDMFLTARLNVSTSAGNSYHQIECHENVPVVSKNGDRCNQIVALGFSPSTVVSRGASMQTPVDKWRETWKAKRPPSSISTQKPRDSGCSADGPRKRRSGSGRIVRHNWLFTAMGSSFLANSPGKA